MQLSNEWGRQITTKAKHSSSRQHHNIIVPMKTSHPLTEEVEGGRWHLQQCQWTPVLLRTACSRLLSAHAHGQPLTGGNATNTVVLASSLALVSEVRRVVS